MFSTEDRTGAEDAKRAARRGNSDPTIDGWDTDLEDDDLGASSARQQGGGARSDLPRLLYIDIDDDLAALLDRVEETGSPAIVVLPEGARAVRGMVSARLLKRRADAAGITLAAVTTARVTIAQFSGVGIPCAPTVGEARLKLSRIIQAGRSKARFDGSTVAKSSADAVTAPNMPSIDPPDVPDQDEDPPTPPDPPWDAPAARGVDQSAELTDESSAEDDTIVVRPAIPADSRRQRLGPPPVKRTHRLRRAVYVLFATILALLLALGTWVVFFPAATITISYAARQFDHSYQVPLGAAGVPLLHTELSQTAQVSVLGTGARLVPGAQATGTITFANSQDGYVVVPAGTVVLAQDGTRFATVEDIQVPAAVHSFSGTTNGQQSVAIRAILGGTSSNSGPGAVVSIEGRLRGVLLVTNYAAITGGTMRTEYSVTPADISGAATRLDQQLAHSETAALNDKYAHSPIRLLGPVKVSTPHITTYTDHGRAAAYVSVTAHVAMDYVHAADIQKVADTFLDRDLAGANAQVVAGSERVTSTVVSSKGKGKNILLHVQARTTPTLDVANLREMLVGRSVADARRLLDGSAANGGWRYTFSTTPGLAGRFPQAAGLINIKVEARTGS
jgi:hypothetical protein